MNNPIASRKFIYLFLCWLLSATCITVLAQDRAGLDAESVHFKPAASDELVAYRPDLEPLIRVGALDAHDRQDILNANAAARQNGGPHIGGRIKKAENPAEITLQTAIDRSRTGQLSMPLWIEEKGEAIRITFNVAVDPGHSSRILFEPIVDIDRMTINVVNRQGASASMNFSSSEQDYVLLPFSRGPLVSVSVSLPADSVEDGNAAFTVAGAALVDEPVAADDCNQTTGDWEACSVNASCVDFSEFPADPRNAVALLTRRFNSTYISFCTGTLINQVNYFQPYVISADHCFEPGPPLNELAAVFDYRSMDCGGVPPPLETLPQAVGAEIIARQPVSDNDMVFLRFHQMPAGQRVFLGWTTDPLANGQTVHRVSHPSGTQQSYTRSSPTSPFSCSAVPTSRYWHTQNDYGSTTGGSSGSALFNAESQFVGQHFGTCHQLDWSECDYTTFRQIDGKFSLTYPEIWPWLERPAATTLEMGEPLGGQTSAELPLRMTYYFFYGPAEDSYEIMLFGDIENADLYVNKFGTLYPTAGTPADCEVLGGSTAKRCLMTGSGTYRIGVHARSNYSNATIVARRLVPGIFLDRFEAPPPPFQFDDIEFELDSLSNGGGSFVTFPYVWVDWSPVSGFRFSGNIGGISESTSWASDLRMEVHTPDGTMVEIGGFDNPGIPWDFQGPTSTDDGYYESVHLDVFSGLNVSSFGEWALIFSNDWDSEDAATMTWDNVKLEFFVE